MAGEVAGEPKKDVKESTSMDTDVKKTKKKKGIFSRIWNAVFRLHGDDFEKRLEHITKEEATILARIKRRTQTWRRMTKHIIILSVLSEVIAVCYAILMTRSLDLNWKMRAVRVLPMFLLPALSFLTYSAIGSFTRMCDRKDQKTLERLRAERQAKIDELKEKTNYYITQQLIQRYDPDPAAKAAAATVLASKLGADSGLKVYLGEDSNAPAGESNDVEVRTTSGLRNRKASQLKTSGTETSPMHHREEKMPSYAGSENADLSQHPLIVEHRNPTGSAANDGGWISRLAALLVGEDPTQSYALICGNCHMHNGLARKEDFPYITYYCPHCNALNRPKQSGEPVSGSNSPEVPALANVDGSEVINSAGGSMGEKVSAGSSPMADVTGTSET